MDLDFSKLDALYSRQARAKRETEPPPGEMEPPLGEMEPPLGEAELLAQGFMPVEGARTPFDGPEAPGRYESLTGGERRSEGPSSAFESVQGKRPYREAYRAAYAFHRRNHPPCVQADYWARRTPGADEPPPQECAYWDRVLRDLQKTAADFAGDPFLTGLLQAAAGELEREYEARKRAAHAQNPL